MMKKLMTFIAGVFVVPTSLLAGELHVYEHNGSVIHWLVSGDISKPFTMCRDKDF